jgi:hypothetical protein
MSQEAGGWPPQGGSQGQAGPGGLPPSHQGGYPSQGQPGGYSSQGAPGGYGQQPQLGGYPSQTGGYTPPGGYGPQAGYPPQGYSPGGYPPAGPGFTAAPPGGPPSRKSPAMIIGIVAAAVVLLAAIGGIILVLNRGDDGQPGSTITPGTPTVEPTTEPTELPTSPGTTDRPTGKPTTTEPTQAPTEEPSGNAIDLGNGISLTPADGYEVQKAGNGYARLSNGEQLFLGQAIQVDASANPGQLCDAWHRKMAEGQSNGRFSDPKTAELNSAKLKGATCAGRFTASNGSGSQDIFVFTLVSVRTDGVTSLGTMYFRDGADSEQLNRDFTAMMNSMLRGQLAG